MTLWFAHLCRDSVPVPGSPDSEHDRPTCCSDRHSERGSAGHGSFHATCSLAYTLEGGILRSQMSSPCTAQPRRAGLCCVLLPPLRDNVGVATITKGMWTSHNDKNMEIRKYHGMHCREETMGSFMGLMDRSRPPAGPARNDALSVIQN